MKTIESWVQDMKSQGAGFANALVVNLILAFITGTAILGFFYVQPKHTRAIWTSQSIRKTLHLSGILKVPFYACFWVASPEPFGQFFLNTNLKQRKEFAQ